MLNTPIPEIGSKGVFTADLEHALDSKDIDLAVHSAKDMPSELSDRYEIIAYTTREDAHDVLVSYHDHLDLESDLIIGTSSTRRSAFFGHYYPGIQTVPVRGNLQTRLKKLKSGKMDALALAFAGVHRLGLGQLIKHSLAKHIFVPAVGQGSLAIEVSSQLDPQKRALIRTGLNDPKTEYCLTAERAFLYTIQGGCSIPAFAHAQLNGGNVKVEGGIISLNGSKIIKHILEGSVGDAAMIGNQLGQMVLDSGGDKILEEIRTN